MRIEKLAVQGFRNLERVEAEFPSRVTFVIGPNGQGKTNLLEAIYLLSQAKSFRHSSISDLLPWGAQDSAACSVEASVSTEDGIKSVSFELEDSRRRVFVNGNRVSKASAFYGQFRAVVFSPDDVQLVKGGPGGRRRFVDRTLSMVDRQFVDHLVSYERALKSRNMLLKRLRRDPSGAEQKLAVWDRLLARHGMHVAAGRRSFAESIEETVGSYYQKLVARSSDFAGAEKVSLSYQGDFLCEGKIRSEDELVSMFAHSAAEDIRRGISTRGIQRDDLKLQIDVGSGPHEARSAASQGQARSFALSLLLAAVDYLSEESGELPVLLLDDIESELDTYRKAALLDLIQDSKSQLILTLTELPHEFLQGVSDSRIMHIQNGALKPE